MTNALYSIYDLKAESYLPIMEGKNDEHAKRTVADAIMQGIPIAAHPEDYELYRICSYDPQTGYITQDTRPERVASVLSIMSQYNLLRERAGGTGPIDGAAGQPAPNGFDLAVTEPADSGEAAADDEG